MHSSLKKKKKIASVLETLFCLSGGEWLRTSCKADNFCFCKYWRQVFESIDNFFFFNILETYCSNAHTKSLILLKSYVCSLHIYWLFAYIRLHAIQSVLPLSVEVQVWSSQYRTSSIGVRRTVLCIILDCSFKEHCTVSTSEWQIDELQQYLFVDVPHNENAILVWILCWNTVLIS